MSSSYKLSKKIKSNDPDTSFRSLVCFPWTNDSLSVLWKGSLRTPDLSAAWKDMITEYSDTVAVGAAGKVYVFHTKRPKNPICIKLPNNSPDVKILPTDVINIAWALDREAPLEPLLLFSHLSLLYIFDMKERKMKGHLRGHGGSITCIAVHPINAHLFCTTSRDFSTRIYDLTLTPQDVPVNTHWPPGHHSSRAGAAHGLHMSTEAEGNGKGRCVLVLMGGRSGGHQAAVLGAAFHPDLPVIATCGLDRLVKIWFVHPMSAVVLTREDKPLFSSSRIHQARVLSVAWLHHDLLLTHSAPALMRNHVDDLENRDTRLEPGRLVIWRWLGIDRFFPPRKYEETPQDVLRGCASDYQESASFKIITTASFPIVSTQYVTPNLHVHQSLDHDPLVLVTYPDSTSIRVFNITHLHPRKPPPFPEAATSESGDRQALPDIPGWDIRINATVGDNIGDNTSVETLQTCVMGIDGKTIIGAGSSLWFWQDSM